MSTTEAEIQLLQAGEAALEAQRALLGDAVVDAALGPMREKLAALQAQTDRAEQQRKQATVLFADVSGFTALSETMDAEVVAGIMNDLWQLVDTAITDHGGRIDKHIGDAVMALWGADGAREDDPERAVRGALAMQAAINAFCTTHNVPLAMRIGVNTGPVLLGQVGTTAEFTAMGDAVNLASRLEHAAPVGGVLISHDTYRQVRGIFDVSPQAPLAVKGKTEPVQTYVVQQAKPRAFRMATRGVEGVETRMVGREAEMLALQSAYADVMESAETRVITVIGEAGVGKSRLLYEFDNWIELRPEQIYYFKGRANRNLQNVPHSLFRDLFAFRFDILDSDPTAVALAKFQAGMAGILDAELADVAGHWLGFDFSSSDAVKLLLGSGNFKAIARAHLTRYFRALAAAGPVVILLEDIHWADDQSLDLVAYLATTIPEARLLVVAVTRPSLFERRPNWSEGEAAFQQVHLKPLSNSASRALVNEILQRVDDVPGALRDLIIDAAEGNPFYVEELIKMLIEQGVIERDIEDLRGLPKTSEVSRWRVRDDKLAAVKVPPTLTGLLQARLDALPRPEREALQRASVIGRLFWDDCVADLLQTETGAIDPVLAATRDRELIFRREHSAFARCGEYIFKHVLLRDVAYETVLLRHKAEYHGRVARWLESHAGERLGEYLSLIAEHYIQAGEGVTAAGLLECAGREALDTGEWLPAARALDQALALRRAAGETAGPAVIAANISLGEAYFGLGDFASSQTAYEYGAAEAQRMGDSSAQVEAYAGLSRMSTLLGQSDRAKELAEAAISLARADGGRLLGQALIAAASVASHLGDIEAAATLTTETLAIHRAVGDISGEAFGLIILGILAAKRGELETAEQHYTAALALARQANHLSHEAGALTNLGSNAYRRGDYIAARAYGRAAQERHQSTGEQQSLLITLGNVAQADLKLGDVDAARRGAREVMVLSRKLGSPIDTVWAVSLLGQILAFERRTTSALALFGLARSQPAVEHQMLVDFDQEIAGLGLPAAEVEVGLSAGAALDFETVVREILDGKW